MKYFLIKYLYFCWFFISLYVCTGMCYFLLWAIFPELYLLKLLETWLENEVPREDLNLILPYAWGNLPARINLN